MSWVWVVLADGVVALHFGYLAVLCFGGVAARWWRRLLGLHLAAVLWAVGAVTVRYDCPLTSLEDAFRRRAGRVPAPEGFLRHYVRGVLFPEWLTPWVVAALAAAVVAGWLGLVRTAVRPASTGAARTPAAARRSPTRRAGRSAPTS